MTSIWQPVRCRTLSVPDKKQIAVLRSMIDVLAVEAATKTNDFDSLFSKLRSLAASLTPAPVEEGTENLYSLSKATIGSLQALIDSSEKDHREDQYKDFFDEAKLRPVAHRCMELWNTVEGFESPPFVDVSEEERAKKKARYEAIASKRKEADEKKRQAVAQREEEVQRRQEMKKVLAAPVQAGLSTVEDSTLPNATPLGFIDYDDIPLVGADEGEEEVAATTPQSFYHEFERALEVWTFLVSLPKPLKLSQFSFSSFVSSLTSPNETHLIECVFNALVVAGVRDSPSIKTPKQVEQQMRGNPWFKKAVQFFDIASGRKQERDRLLKEKMAKKRQREESSDDDSASPSEEEEESKKAEDEEKQEEVEDSGFDAEVRALSEELQSLGRLALYVNLSIHERLVFLKFLVDCVIDTPTMSSAADTLEHLVDLEQLHFEKRVKELRQVADRKLKQLSKSIPATPHSGGPSDAVPVVETRESVVADLKAAIRHEVLTVVKKWESGDVGAKIVPIGQDRYKRLYWRFPLDPNVYVQTTSETAPFPLAERPPKPTMLFDEEDGPQQAGSPTAKPKFQVWGRIAPEYLPAFIASLDKRGTREANLKAQLEPLAGHLAQLAAPVVPTVMTRSRATYGGYRNTFLEV